MRVPNSRISFTWNFHALRVSTHIPSMALCTACLFSGLVEISSYWERYSRSFSNRASMSASRSSFISCWIAAMPDSMPSSCLLISAMYAWPTTMAAPCKARLATATGWSFACFHSSQPGVFRLSRSFHPAPSGNRTMAWSHWAAASAALAAMGIRASAYASPPIVLTSRVTWS